MTAAAKVHLRAQILATRRAVPDSVREAESAALRAYAVSVAELAETVCAYVPVRTEPGSIALLDTLLAAGARVLLPVSRTASDGTPAPLWWGTYHPGQLVSGRYGLLEPAEPRLPPGTVAEAGVVIIPALAVDRRGVRLGRGAGYYDRTLPLRHPATRLIAIVRDEEFVDELPDEPHDVRMTDALTPGGGLVVIADSPG
jgi:5-formyltetrahydrofolate cyclo-ligase